MDRIFIFLTSIIIIASIAVISRTYMWRVTKHFGDKMNSIQWLKENQKKLAFLFAAPHQFIFAPTSEELLFRAPLLIMFSSLSGMAWYGIVISSILFGLIHFVGKGVRLDELEETETDDLKIEIEKYYQEHRKVIIYRKLFHVVFCSILGVVLGYIGVVYQSLWLCVIVHALWNMFGSIAVIIIAIIAQIIVNLFAPFWNWATR